MARLIWGSPTERFFEAGVDRGVLYLPANPGVVWNGLISVAENPSGGGAQPYYQDGIKYLNLAEAEEFEATLTAFSSPREFGPCDGNVQIQSGLIATQQPRRSFGLSYRTKIGNMFEGADFAYKIHLVYNALAAPANRTNNSLGGSADPSTLSWSITTKPPTLSGFKPTAHLVIDSRYTDPDILLEVEEILYGTEADFPRIPDPDELIDIFTP